MNVMSEIIVVLFDCWNNSFQIGDFKQVVVNYVEQFILLLIVFNILCLILVEKEDYFVYFFQNKLFGEIDLCQIEISGDIVVDSGFYIFIMCVFGVVVKVCYIFVYKWDGINWLIIFYYFFGMFEGQVFFFYL